MPGTPAVATDPSRPRRRRRIALLVGGGVLLAAAGLFVAAYLLFFTDDSPPPLKLSHGTGGAPASALAGTWGPTGDGEAGYRVREKLAFLPAQSDAVGRTTAVTGSFTLTDDGQSLVARDVLLTVDVSTLTSNEARRDNRLRTSGLETDRFRTARFVSSGPIDVPDAARQGKAVTATARGRLTIHGVTKTVAIRVHARASGGTIELAGSYSFPMAKFEIDPPSIANFVSVEDHATMEFRLVFSKQA